MNLRVVIDPGVLVSAILVRNGAPGQVLDAWHDHRFELIASPLLIAELDDVLSREKFADCVSQPERLALVALLRDESRIEIDPPFDRPLTVDPDDDYLAALVLSTDATHLITGDHGLANWSAPNVSVVSPREFLSVLDGTASDS